MSGALADLSAAQIVGFLSDAAERWRNPDLPARVRTVAALVARTGYSTPVVEYALDRLMEGLGGESLRAAIESEVGSLAALDGFVSRPGRPSVHARAAGRVLVIASRTTIGVALPAAVYALAAKNHVVVKDREDRLVTAFFATLAEEHPAFAEAAVAEVWEGAAPERLADADVVVAFGSDETLAEIRAAMPVHARFVGHGSRISCGYLTREARRDPQRLQGILAGAARDVVLYDGEGCMSLHVLFVERRAAADGDDLPEIADRLADAIEGATVEFPPSRRGVAATIATSAVREGHRFRAAIGRSIGAQSGAACVVVDAESPPPLMPLTTLIVPVDADYEILGYLKRYGLRVETLAVDTYDAAATVLARMIGAVRITAFGTMQNPALSGEHGGRSCILDFVELTGLDDQRDIDYTADIGAKMITRVPGPRSLELAISLADHEARGVTYLAQDYPIFWESASGANVTDVDGNRYIDMGAAFGVAAVGHSNPRVVGAIRAQARKLMHGMGDVHPSAIRARYLEKLISIAPEGMTRAFLGCNGADAVEFALKTAMLATGKPKVLTFDGGYHGLSYGTLEVGGIDRFRLPFLAQLPGFSRRAPYPSHGSYEQIRRKYRTILRDDPEIGAILIEPIAGRAGTILPADTALAALRALADEFNIVLIFDEIYTGFGRTGAWFACQHDKVIPDIMCIGKAMGGGFPLSGALGNTHVMNAWPASSGEALHTSTYLGNPMACAAGLAVIEEMQANDLPGRAAREGRWFGEALGHLAGRLSRRYGRPISARGRGLMWALDLGDSMHAVRSVVWALRFGVILLPQGVAGTAIAITPPLVITRPQLERGLELLEQAIRSAWRELHES